MMDSSPRYCLVTFILGFAFTREITQINLVFYSLIRTFAADYVNGRPKPTA